MPPASSTLRASDARSRPIFAMRPPRMPTSARYCCAPVPSTTRPSFRTTSSSGMALPPLLRPARRDVLDPPRRRGGEQRVDVAVVAPEEDLPAREHLHGDER